MLKKTLSLLLITTGFLVDYSAAAQDKPQSSGSDRADIYQPDPRAKALVAKMTLSEKIDLLSGGSFMGTKPLPRLGIPSFRMSDGPVGAHVPPPSTAIGGGIGLAASWDPGLAEATGYQLGRDARSRGVHFLLGPGVNIYRTPLNGRNFEYFGEDPFLASRIAVGYIEGLQKMGVSATIKHFLGNNSEYARYTSNSIIDEHTLREMYMPAFEAAVKEAHVGAVMSSYNKTNGSYMAQNGPIVLDVLERDWAFSGVYMSDWTAVHDGLGSVNGGLDLEMPFGTYMNRKTLEPAVKEGKVNVSTIDEHVERMLSLAYRFGWMQGEQLDYGISRYDPQGATIARRNAEEGAVLLKNDGLLPLDAAKVTVIAVLGQDSFPAVPAAGGSGYVASFHGVSLLEGISAQFPKATVTYARGVKNINLLTLETPFTVEPDGKSKGVTVQTFHGQNLEGPPISTTVEGSMSAGSGFNANPDSQPDYSTITEEQLAAMMPSNAEATSQRWTGYYNAAREGDFSVFVQSLASLHLLVDDKVLIDNREIAHASLNQTTIHLQPGSHKFSVEVYGVPKFFGNQIRAGIVATDELVDPYALELAKRADVVVIGVGYTADNETEGGDRSFELPVGQDDLVKRVAAINKHVVVAVTSGGSVDLSPWLERISGLFELWYPGQEGGNAFAELLAGERNPSGHLPISWEKRLEDNPSIANYWYTDPKTQDIPYREGVFVGYRGYDKKQIAPQFPFGFGLSYTNFSLSHLKVTREPSKDAYTIRLDVKNSGLRAGADVVQLYVKDPHATSENASQELKGFMRVELAPGETKSITMQLSPRSFSHYDVTTQLWTAPAGDRSIRVGHSERDLPLEEVIHLDHRIETRD